MTTDSTRPAAPVDFASDNHAGAHPEVLEALAAANAGHAASYGADPWTARAEGLVREHFGDGARAFFVFNGTGANVASIDALTRPWEAVICTDVAHMHVDECGAPERLSGVKLLTVAHRQGKLAPADLAQLGGAARRRAPGAAAARLDHPVDRARDRLLARRDEGRSPTPPTSSACTCTSTARGSPTRRRRSRPASAA